MPVAFYKIYSEMLDMARKGHDAYPSLNVTSLQKKDELRITQIQRKNHKRLMHRSLRAPERCAAISPVTVRLLRFTRNDNSYRWIWV
jgi:hypothetical protein